MDIQENFIYLEMRNYNCVDLNKHKKGSDDDGDPIKEKELLCDYDPAKSPETSGPDT